jgi:hypothetical protein
LNFQQFVYSWDAHVNPNEREDNVVPLEKDEHQPAGPCQMWTGSVHTAHNGSLRNAMGLASCNHLRFCKAHRLCQSGSRSHQRRNSMPLVHETLTITDSLNNTSSLSDSDSLSSSSFESDTPVIHRRRARQVRSPSAAETCEPSHVS